MNALAEWFEKASTFDKCIQEASIRISDAKEL